jgi:hypothetical protein
VIIYEYSPKKLSNYLDYVLPGLGSGVLRGPPVVVKLAYKPISRVELGFAGGRVYVFGLFREVEEVNGQKRETCSVRKVGLRAGVDWLKVKKMMA